MHEYCGTVLDAQITVRQHLVSALLARQIVSLFKARTVKPRRGVCFPEYRRYDVAADNIEKFHCTFLDIIRSVTGSPSICCAISSRNVLSA